MTKLITVLRWTVMCGALLGPSQLFGNTVNPGALPCSTTTLDGYILDGSTGCTLGGVFTASGFAFTASAGAPLSASQITVTPTVIVVGGVTTLIDFNFSENFDNATANPLQYTFDYILDPASSVILGAAIALDPGGMLTENICAGGSFSGSSCTAFGTTLVATSLLPNASTAFPTNVSTVDYQIVLDLPAGASAGGLDSESVTGLGAGTTTPEPSSILLTVSGLLGFLPFRKRRTNEVSNS